MNEQLTVSISPHIHSRHNTASVMRDVIIALMPALAASSFIFGMRSLLLTAISIISCVLFELIWEKLLKREVTVGDLSAVVTGILVAFNVPVTMPVWQLIVGDAAAIIVAKMLFGGIGCNFMNPALVGRIVMFFSFTDSMTDYSGHVTQSALSLIKGGSDIVSSATPLAVSENLTSADLPALFFGVYGGVLGETCTAALILGGLYLIFRRLITPTIPLTFIGGVAFFTFIFGGDAPLLSVLSGGVMLGAVFMATDYVTTPQTESGRLIFGIGCAFITVMIRLFANCEEGVSFAILLMNVLVPYIDGLCKTKPAGAIKAAR